VRCRSCGEELDPRRAELGYDYCMRRECQDRMMKRVELARVAVNKAADQYVRAEDVIPKGPRPRWGIDEEEEGEEETERSPRPRQEPIPGPRPSTEQTLRRASEQLDAALMDVYERFCRSEVTAAEMRSEQNALIRAFNDRVRRENIRYRRFLRKPV
jgi:hypothetical protein